MWFRCNNWTHRQQATSDLVFCLFPLIAISAFEIEASVETFCLSLLLLFTFTDFQGLFKAMRHQKWSGNRLCIVCPNQLQKLYLHCKWFVEISKLFLFFALSNYQSPAVIYHYYIKVFRFTAFYSGFTAFYIGELLPRCCCMWLWIARGQKLLGEVKDQGRFQRNCNLQCLRSRKEKYCSLDFLLLLCDYFWWLVLFAVKSVSMNNSLLQWSFYIAANRFESLNCLNSSCPVCNKGP